MPVGDSDSQQGNVDNHTNTDLKIRNELHGTAISSRLTR
jgi:hypothetical protein